MKNSLFTFTPCFILPRFPLTCSHPDALVGGGGGLGANEKYRGRNARSVRLAGARDTASEASILFLTRNNMCKHISTNE